MFTLNIPRLRRQMSLQKTESVAFLSSGASLFNLFGFIKSAEFCWNLLSDTNECCILPWDNEQSVFMFSFQARQKSNNLGLKLLCCWWNAFYITLKSVEVSLFMTANEQNVRRYNAQMWGSIDGREPWNAFFPLFYFKTLQIFSPVPC